MHAGHVGHHGIYPLATFGDDVIVDGVPRSVRATVGATLVRGGRATAEATIARARRAAARQGE